MADRGFTNFRLTVEVRDLILRAHRRGPQFGLPLGFLAYSYSNDSRNEGSLQEHKTFKAEVINDSLLLRRTEQWNLDSKMSLMPQL